MLWSRRESLALLVLNPHFDDPSLAVAGTAVFDDSFGFGIAAEIELQVAIGHLMGIPQVNG
jgi:hypothetical protein